MIWQERFSVATKRVVEEIVQASTGVAGDSTASDTLGTRSRPSRNKRRSRGRKDSEESDMPDLFDMVEAEVEKEEAEDKLLAKKRQVEEIGQHPTCPVCRCRDFEG